MGRIKNELNISVEEKLKRIVNIEGHTHKMTKEMELLIRTYKEKEQAIETQLRNTQELRAKLKNKIKKLQTNNNSKSLNLENQIQALSKDLHKLSGKINKT
jgi:hypothetical protein